MRTVTKLTRAEQNAANRSAVLAAAWEVFSEVGYVAATLDRIAEVAGFSKGAVYSRFESKADMFLALLEQRIAERAQANAREFDRALAAGGDVVAALAKAMVARSGDDLGWRLALVEFRVATARDPQLRERYAALHKATIDALAELFDALAARLGSRLAMPSRSLAVTALALDLGTMLEELADGTLSATQRVGVMTCILRPATGAST